VLPSLVNSALLLSRAGYQVDLVTVATDRFPGLAPHDFGDPAIRVVPYRPGPLARLRGVGWVWSVPGLARTIERAVRDGPPYRCLIGVDADGLLAATRVGTRLGLPVVYYSLEMEIARGETRRFIEALVSRLSPPGIILRRYLKNRLSAWFKKPLERRAHRRARFTIALDEERARTLLADNRLPGADVVIVPTSPLALGRALDRDYLRRRLGIAPGQKILLHSGGITDVYRSLELAESVRRWPPDWTLVIHGFSTDPVYVARLRALADGRRLVVSTDLVPYQELDDLVASADIGLALYRGFDSNHVAMASGKVLQYLKCGVPAIATDFPSLRRILHGHGSGRCVRDEGDLEPAAREILADHRAWSDRARRCFEDHFDFAVHFEAVIRRLRAL
jgi:glycosyltransferase involved in cell wall biosynthesis